LWKDKKVWGIEEGSVGEGYALADNLAPSFEDKVGTDGRVDFNPELAAAGLTEAAFVLRRLAGFEKRGKRRVGLRTKTTRGGQC
jgi:hypothetical protein